jgi:hypothetical protein
MKTPTGDRKNCRTLRLVMSLIVGYSFVGCALPVSNSPKVGATNEVQSGKVQTVRVIISFQRPTPDNRSLFAAISDACECTPVFFRTFGTEGLIYEITMRQGRAFADFEKQLLRKAPQLGIVSIEQDSLEHF